MVDIFNFNISVKGYSHIGSGKPCQDYSLNWTSDDNSIHAVVIADGHGSKTYVRSDVGSRLACEIALENIKSFVSNIPKDFFAGKSGQVTAAPYTIEDNLFPMQGKRNTTNLSESETEQLEQDKAYYDAVKDLQEEEAIFKRLFGSIYLQWVDALDKYTAENPLNEDEKSTLGNNKIVKAYGSTLMAFVRTPDYWFAFQIGDGKMVAFDRSMNWSEPVPWDCNCFLNVTTSLCNTEPVRMFRYAFSGRGDFPTAVFLGSDGIDDSWGTIENLADFYSETLSIFNRLGADTATKELEEYLPEMSRKGSRDDMTIAAILDMDTLPNAVESFSIKKKINAIDSEKRQLEEKLRKLTVQKNEIEDGIKDLEEKIGEKDRSFSAWLNSIVQKKKTEEESIKLLKTGLVLKKEEAAKVSDEIDRLSEHFKQWELENKEIYKSLNDQLAKIASCAPLDSSSCDADESSLENIPES